MYKKNRVAIVTGGSSGIGQAICVTLAKSGFNVVVTGTNPLRIEETLQLLEQFLHTASAHIGRKTDVTNEKEVRSLVEITYNRFERIDLLVASAGIGKSAGSKRVLPYSAATLPLCEWKAVLDVNLTGVYLTNRAVLPIMKAQKSGQIINIGSSTTPHGLKGTPYAPAYCASKFALAGFTQALAAEVEGDGIRVQTVFPGPVETPLVDNTLLAKPFGGIVRSDNFSNAVMALIEYPMDSTVIDPHILPMRGKG
ncbi:MAG: SDR family oxidoreductase [Gammaproteobacteria bacterium]|nr:SDR family oxidoreductase [Gammaproteobacteria bacterium]